MSTPAFRPVARLATIAVAATLSASAARAQTVAQYDFETADGNSNAIPLDIVLFDVSGSGLDLAAGANNVAVNLTAEVAPLMPANTLAFDSNQAGANAFSTPATNLLGRGLTGEMTIEFWYKPLVAPSVYGYLFNYGAQSETGRWGIYLNTDGSLRYFDTYNGFNEVNLGTGIHNGDWNHVAFTVDAPGVMTGYLNGVQVAQSGATGAAGAPILSSLNLGGDFAHSWADHRFLIDDLRISNAALPAGSGTGVGELAWNAPLSMAPAPDPRSADFGRQWVRSHPYTITSWGFTSYPDFYTEANFNAALGGEYAAVNAAGVTPMFLGDLTELTDRTRTRVQIALTNGVKAFLLRDEMPLSETADIKAVADYIRSVDSEALLIVGLGSSTPSYVDQAIQETQPDAVIHGFYPFSGPTSATDQWYAGGLTDVALIRERALFYDLPYFAFIQSFEDFDSGLNPPDFARRLPSESELRAELFSKLSAGVKGLAYFVFQDGSLEDIALVSPAGVKSSLYAPAAAANQEIAVLGRVLRFLESSDWRFVSGGVATTPAYMQAMDAGAGFGKLLGVSVDGAPADRRDALVGMFLDDEGGEYFMLVNAFHGQGLTADDAAVSFTLTFDDSVTSIWRLNRLNGEVEELTIVNNTLNLTLPGGTGDLFRFGDGAFIPEPASLTLVGLPVLFVMRRRRHSSRGRRPS